MDQVVHVFLQFTIGIFLTINISIMCILFAQSRQTVLQGMEPLPDVGRDLLVNTPQWFTDVSLFGIVLLTAWFKCIPSIRYFRNVCYVYILRAIVIAVTTYPPLHIPLYGSTADLLFSGHTVAFWAIADLLDAKLGYSMWRSFVLRFIAPLSLISSRQHYTSDVIVAASIMFLLPGRRDCLWVNVE